jgi:serine/threonine protein phosphatase PrpC
VPASLRAGVAHRARLHKCEPADFVRVRQDGAVTLAVLGNAYDSGFATCWPAGSRLLLDLFFAEWDAGDARSPLAARLLTTFAATRQRFVAEAAALITPDADFPEDAPTAAMLAVVSRGHTAHVAWIGGDVAVLARRGEAAEVTAPHTLREQVRRERPELVQDLSAVPDILSRTIGAGAPDQGPPSRATFQMHPGDWLLLLSRAAFTGPCVSPQVAAAATITEAATDATALAEHLLARDFTEASAPPYVAIAALYCPSESHRSRRVTP